MLVTFRQGIVRVQITPNFLNFDGVNVNINANTDPTVVTFADGSADYLYSETESVGQAWTGPFLTGNDYHLFWDINKITGLRTFGFTLIEPSFGLTRPVSPITDQHFFDTNIEKMIVWSGTRWVDKLRVFSGELQNGNLLIPESVGSQINLNRVKEVGHILFDESGNAITRSSGQFLTTETLVNASDNPLNSYKLEAKQIRARGTESIPKFHVVRWSGPNAIGVASNLSPNLGEGVGIAIEDINKDEVRKFVTDGFVINEEWNFTEVPGTPLFVGQNGEVTATVPQRTSLQRIGQVVDPNTAFIRIEELFRIDPTPVTPTPTVTPTSSAPVTPAMTPTNTVTPSITPTITLTISITPSVTPTITITPTITVTPSVTPTITVSPTITPTVTPTITVSPTITPTITVSPTITPTISLTPTETPTPTATATPTNTVTPTITPTNTVTPSVTPTNTVTPTVTPTNTVTPTLTPSPSAP